MKKLALIFLFVIGLFFPNGVLAQTATNTTVNPNPTTTAVAPTTLSVPSTSNTTTAVATINSTVQLIANNSPNPSTSATSTSILPLSTGSTSNSSAPTTVSSMVKEEGAAETRFEICMQVSAQLNRQFIRKLIAQTKIDTDSKLNTFSLVGSVIWFSFLLIYLTFISG